jgi:hypothetical protein
VVSALWQRQRIDQFRRQAELLYFQRKLRTFSPPDSQVVFENDQTQIPQIRGGFLKESRLFDRSSVLLWRHPYLDELKIPTGSFSSLIGGLVFLHERSTPAGDSFIVVCVISPMWGGQGVLFQLSEFRPAGWSSGIIPRNGLNTSLPEIDRALAAGKHVRLYAGQPDPLDSTHFTIRCEIDGKQEFIDGYEGDRKVGADGVPVPGLRLEFHPNAH